MTREEIDFRNNITKNINRLIVLNVFIIVAVIILTIFVIIL